MGHLSLEPMIEIHFDVLALLREAKARKSERQLRAAWGRIGSHPFADSFDRVMGIHRPQHLPLDIVLPHRSDPVIGALSLMAAYCGLRGHLDRDSDWGGVPGPLLRKNDDQVFLKRDRVWFPLHLETLHRSLERGLPKRVAARTRGGKHLENHRKSEGMPLVLLLRCPTSRQHQLKLFPLYT